jgi:hypothetical protein
MALQTCPQCRIEQTTNLRCCGGCGFDLGSVQIVSATDAPTPSRPTELGAHTDKTANPIEGLRQ